MTTSFLLGALLLRQDRVAVKEVLSNGATLYAQRLSGTSEVAFAISFVQRNNPEPPETHGLRHLAEHLLAKGSKRDIDQRLESLGSVLLAETSRDFVTFRATLPSSRWPDALAVLKSLIDPVEVTETELNNEVKVLNEELALRSWAVRLVSDGWRRTYGADALDPFGDPAKLSGLTAAQVSQALTSLRDPRSLCIAVVGDVDPEAVVRRLTELVGTQSPTQSTDEWDRQPGNGTVRVGSADGEGVCVSVPGFMSSEALANLAAAFGFRAWTAGAVALYTPSARPGVVTLAVKSPASLPQSMAKLTGRESLVARTGLATLRQWLREVSNDPPKLAKLTAELLPLYPSFDAMSLSKTGDSISVIQVERAVKSMIKASTEAPQ